MAPTEQTQILQRVTQLTAAGHPLPGELLEALCEWLEDQEDEAVALAHEQAMATGTTEVLDLREVSQQRGWTLGGLQRPDHGDRAQAPRYAAARHPGAPVASHLGAGR